MPLIKFNNIIPAGEKKFAYQCENIHIDGILKIKGFMPFNSGSEPYLNDEKNVVKDYDLLIEKFTSNSFTVTLKKNYKDGTQQGYETTFNFALFVNQIFKNIEVYECLKK